MLELKGLSYQVEGGGTQTDILRGIDLTIPDGSFVVITGPNGGGKTTLAKAIMGIAQPTGGQIAHRGNTEEVFPLILADTLGGCPVIERKEASL